VITFLTMFILTHPVNFPCGGKPGGEILGGRPPPPAPTFTENWRKSEFSPLEETGAPAAEIVAPLWQTYYILLYHYYSQDWREKIEKKVR
jgi:hypothetical protein